MFFNSIKEVIRLSKEIYKLGKEINSLLSKEMSNIYLKVTKKNWLPKTSIFYIQKICHQINFWGAPSNANVIEF